MNQPPVVLSVLAVVLAWLAGPTPPPGSARAGRVRTYLTQDSLTQESLTQESTGGYGPTGEGRWLVLIGLLAPAFTAAMLWGAMVIGADPLAEGLSVTAATVRVAAGIGLLVVSMGRCWAAMRPGSPGPPALTREGGEVTLEAMLRGPVRVEVAVTVWSLALDHGTATGLLVVGTLSGLSGLSGLSDWRDGTPILPLARAALTVAAVITAVLLTVTGVFGL